MDDMTNTMSLIVAAMLLLYGFGAHADCSGPLSFYAVAEYKSGSIIEVRHIIARTYDYSSADVLKSRNNGHMEKTTNFTESEMNMLKGFIKRFMQEEIGNKSNIENRFSFVDGYTLTLPATPKYSDASFHLIDTKHTQAMTSDDVNNIHRFLYFNYNEFAYPAVVSENVLDFVKNKKPYRVRELRYDFGSKYALDYMSRRERKTVELTYQEGCL